MNTKYDLIRYHIDFDDMSILCSSAQGELIQRIFEGAGAFLSALYNKFWSRYGGSGKPFHTHDFTVRHLQNEQRNILYITLPKVSASATMACTHIVIAFMSDGNKYSNIQMFNIERSLFGAPFIGSMQVENKQVVSHLNFGEAGDTDEENIDIISDLAFPKSRL